MALLFDGTNDTLDFGDIAALDAPAAFTIAFDLMPLAGLANNDGICEKRSAGTNGILLYQPTATVIALSFNGATDQGSISGMLDDDVWGHHIFTFNGAGSLNAGRLQYYKNGVAQAITFAGTIPAAVITSTTAQYSIAENVIGGLFSNFRMANHMIWTGHFSAAEAAQQAQMRRPVRTSDLLIWTPIDGSDGTDYSGNGFNGTVVGAVAIDGPPRNYGAAPLTL